MTDAWTSDLSHQRDPIIDAAWQLCTLRDLSQLQVHRLQNRLIERQCELIAFEHMTEEVDLTDLRRLTEAEITSLQSDITALLDLITDLLARETRLAQEWQTPPGTCHSTRQEHGHPEDAMP